MKFRVVVVLLLTMISVAALSQKTIVYSPNQKISATLFSKDNADVGEWYLKVFYSGNGKVSEVIPRTDLGLDYTGGTNAMTMMKGE